MDMLTIYADALQRNTDRIAALRPDQLSAATPCRSWPVSALLAHVIGGQEMFAAAMGHPMPDAAPADPGSVPELAAAYRRAADAALGAFAQPDAMRRTAVLPVGEVPGEMVVGLALTDTVVHGWDLAVATGQDATIPPDLAAVLLGGAQTGVGDDLREPDGAMPVFAQPVSVPEDAPAPDQLLAFLGRDPRWSPGM
jgi:uncharacterized protein (TIGR03086 family)